MLSTNEKKPLSSCSDASKITELFHKTLLRGQQQISGAILQCVFENHCGKAPYSIVLSADKNLWSMPSSDYYSS